MTPEAALMTQSERRFQQSESLRRFEQRLISARTTAGQVESWEAYRADMLPTDLADHDDILLAQGFQAGYDAAMGRVRVILADVQTEVLREKR